MIGPFLCRFLESLEILRSYKKGPIILPTNVQCTLRQMPSKYRATYRRAVKGRSLRACVNAFCQECCGWQSREVADCTDLGCPVYRVRPYQDGPGNGRDERFAGVEGPNDAEAVG